LTTTQQAKPAEKQQFNQNHPCFEQFQQFLQCTQNSSNVSMCQGFDDALKECKLRHGAI
jgi:ubiquitin carboxyl-terminal hydrolase 6/32